MVPGSTSYHEAAHAVAAIATGSHVVEASRVPGSGYLGRTILNEFNAVAFMAAHAMGCSGTGHDMAVVMYMGHNPSSLAWAAKSVLAGREEELFAVASAIEEKGTISGYEAEEAMDKAVNPEAEIVVINPDGEERRFITEVRGRTRFIIPIGIPEKQNNGVEEVDKLVAKGDLINTCPYIQKIHGIPFDRLIKS